MRARVRGLALEELVAQHELALGVIPQVRGSSQLLAGRRHPAGVGEGRRVVLQALEPRVPLLALGIAIVRFRLRFIIRVRFCGRCFGVHRFLREFCQVHVGREEISRDELDSSASILQQLVAVLAAFTRQSGSEFFAHERHAGGFVSHLQRILDGPLHADLDEHPIRFFLLVVPDHQLLHRVGTRLQRPADELAVAVQPVGRLGRQVDVAAVKRARDLKTR